MEKTISSEEPPDQFGQVLREVSDRGDRYVVERDGVPFAAVVPLAIYVEWKRRRERFFNLMRETAARVDLSEDAAMELIDGAKRAVRARP